MRILWMIYLAANTINFWILDVKKVLVYCLLLLVGLATPSQAAKVESWKYRGEIAWKHPDGRTIYATYADTRVDNDVLRIIREDSGEWLFIEMKLIGNGTLLKNSAHFFVLDKPTKTNAQKAHRISATVWPGAGNKTGSLVSELKRADLAALDKYAGNLVGATYVSRRSSDRSDGRWSTYYFLAPIIHGTVTH